MASQGDLLTDAYLVGVTLTSALNANQSLCTALRTPEGPFNLIEDGYPEWHPAPHSFEGILRLFFYRKLTGESYRTFGRYPKLTDVFGQEKIPVISALMDVTHPLQRSDPEFLTTGAQYVVKEIHD